MFWLRDETRVFALRWTKYLETGRIVCVCVCEWVSAKWSDRSKVEGGTYLSAAMQYTAKPL